MVGDETLHQERAGRGGEERLHSKGTARRDSGEESVKETREQLLISLIAATVTGARVPSGPSYRWQNRDFVSGLADAIFFFFVYFKVYFMSLFTLIKSLCTLVAKWLGHISVESEVPSPSLLAHTMQTAGQTFKNPSLAEDRPLQAPDSSGKL